MTQQKEKEKGSSPKFKDLKFGAEFGGMMDDGVNYKFYPCRVGDFLIAHLKGGTGKKKLSEYQMRKGKTNVIELCDKKTFLEKFEQLNYTFEWGEGEWEGKVVVKHHKKGIVKSLLGIK